ncbi:MAG: c-type cytochrome [Paracoccaceae bacterium]
MLDTMTFTKVLGGFCGALLIFLLGKWVADSLYEVGGPHGERVEAYVIDTGEEEDTAEAESAPEEEEEAPADFETVFASADADAGERVWNKCRACHQLEDGANATGPHLYGVVDREVGAVEDFRYSGALTEVADVWTPENLNGFLEDPRGYAPGTSMSFAGLPDVEDRANLIAYLQTVGD